MKVNWQTKGKNNCRHYARATVKKLPAVLRSVVAHKHADDYNKDYRSANLKLTQLNKIISETHMNNQPLKDFFDEEKLLEVAKYKAQVCAISTAGLSNEDAFTLVRSYLENIGIDTDAIMAGSVTDFGLVARAKDYSFWRKQLRKITGRSAEKLAINYGLLGNEQLYCSDFAVARFRAMRGRNNKMLETTLVRNQYGHEYSLKELHDKSTANPELRRKELMTRIRGFEEYSRRRKSAAVFITMTCPSKYHANSKKFTGNDPRVSQEYLCRTWSRIRAALARLNVHAYGFRVAEPHQDGTPHWHLLLFTKPEQQKTLTAVFNKYCFEEDGREKGARKSRLKFEFIDRRKGSAASYIAKYVAKNIDGHSVGSVHDIDGNILSISAADNAERVAAWSSLWGIRQFQQFGGECVTLWRTLRKLKSKFEGEAAEQARINADEGNWDLFTEYAQGSMMILEKELTGEANVYGELMPPKVVGVRSLLGAYTELTDGAMAASEVQLVEQYDWELLGAASQPWTSVNNCTHNQAQKAEHSKVTPLFPRIEYEMNQKRRVERIESGVCTVNFIEQKKGASLYG